MNRSPWIVLGATAILTAISGVTNSGGGPPAGSVGMGTQASPGQVLGAPPGAITNSVVSLNAPTRLEWLDQEPITLKYVPPPEGSVDAPTLRGTAGVRKLGQNGDEHVAFSPFRVQSDSVARNGFTLEKPLTLDLRNDAPTVVDIVLGIPPECFFRPASFDAIFFTSLQKPANCFPLTGYVIADNSPVTAKDPTLKPEQKVLSWTALLPVSTDLERQVMSGTSAWAAAIVALALIVSWILKAPPWSVMEGAPNWDFQRSWAANIALGGGLLTALVTLASLNPIILGKSTYNFLDLWTIALLAIGPMIYAAFSWTKQGKDGPVTCSPVGCFFAASFVVLWAALMQLRLVRLLIAELRLDKTITEQVESWASRTIGTIAIVLLVYAAFSLVKTAGKHVRLEGVTATTEAHWPLL